MQQIGRYQITGDLGSGAMGVVYRAVDPAIGRTVAIKTIRLSELGDDALGQQLRERLFREARSAGLLSHPNIVTIYDVAEFDGNAYIAMEFVDGPNLDQLIRDTPPSRDALLSLLQQVAAALDYAHSKGIVHRDIKPANILVHEGNIAKIADFGVARIENHQATQAGTLMGTPTYMSPEQIQGESVSGRSDQYSLGVIAYELLTGEKPFVAPSMPTLLFKIMRDAPPPVDRLNPSLSGEVGAVIQKALSKDAGDRFPDCHGFTDALASALRDAPRWQPLAAGDSLTMPTVMGVVDVPPAPLPAEETPVIVPDLHTPRLGDESPRSAFRNWWLIPAVLALALAGFLFLRRPAAPSVAGAPETTVSPASETGRPAVVPPPSAEPPSPPPASEEPAVKTPVAKAPPTESKSQNFQLITSPSAAKVTFDGDAARTCTSPCSVQLTAGPHRFTAELDGYRPAFRRFTLPADHEITLAMEKPSGTLLIRSNPPGAQVFVDGQAQPGQTPVSLNLVVGAHEIRVVREGSPPFSTNVTIRDQGLANLEVELPKPQ